MFFRVAVETTQVDSTKEKLTDVDLELLDFRLARQLPGRPVRHRSFPNLLGLFLENEINISAVTLAQHGEGRQESHDTFSQQNRRDLGFR